jgi:hypothetical protein
VGSISGNMKHAPLAQTLPQTGFFSPVHFPGSVAPRWAGFFAIDIVQLLSRQGGQGGSIAELSAAKFT